MKSFLNFFSEARQTKASTKAKQLGLKGDGQGNWVDKVGNIVAKELKPVNSSSRVEKAVRKEKNQVRHHNTKLQKDKHQRKLHNLR